MHWSFSSLDCLIYRTETGPATVTSFPGFNSNGGNVAVYSLLGMSYSHIIRLKNTVKGESQRPAGNSMVSIRIINYC